MAENLKLGYYTQDTGDNDVFYYYMGAEPPKKQYILIGGVWWPLADGWFLMDMIIDGNPEVTGPVPDPPEGLKH